MRQLRAVFSWISDHIEDGGIVAVETSLFSGYLSFSHGSKMPRWIVLSPAKATVSFTVRTASRKRNLKTQAPFDIDTEESSWHPLFTSPAIEVYENTRRKKINTPMPLRWGLSDDEKKIALQIARCALKDFLGNKKKLSGGFFETLPTRFKTDTSLDVAIWIGGELRGSVIVENKSLGEGIAEAAVKAARDSRFKPVEAEELSDATIEITIFSDLLIPLSEREIVRGDIYYDKGYLGVYGNTRGWYLPAVFNCLAFATLEQFLCSLRFEKMKLPGTPIKPHHFFVFEVDDFIETRQGNTLSLAGPIFSQKSFSITTDHALITERLAQAADWLCNIQEKDGNIPAIIDPPSGRVIRRIDWPRLAFTGWSLAEFGIQQREQRYRDAAERSFMYLKKYLVDEKEEIKMPSRTLTLAYVGTLALSLKKTAVASRLAGIVEKTFPHAQFEMLGHANIVSFFNHLATHGTFSAARIGDVMQTLKEQFQHEYRNNQHADITSVSELVRTFKDIDPGFSRDIAAWLIEKQLASGAFPQSSSTNFAYTRGTSKIFEVLALEPNIHKEAIEHALTWLFSMQYDEENTFFVPPDLRPRILGGFRHDYFNQEAWIDAAAHVLLGGTRLLKAQA